MIGMVSGLSFTPGITATAETFRKYMHLLKERFHPVTLNDIADWVNGSQIIPARSVAVTFDDGFADNYHVAAPIMEEFGIRGTFYLTSGCVEHQTLPWFCKILGLFEQTKNKNIILHDTWAKRDWQFDSPQEHREAYLFYLNQCAALSWKQQNERIEWLENHLLLKYNDAEAPPMMTWKMARELIQRGHIIGNHTYSHPILTLTLPIFQQRIEPSKSLSHTDCSKRSWGRHRSIFLIPILA